VKIPSQEARDLVYGDSEDGRVLEDKITGVSRWSEQHEVIVEYKGETYRTKYRKGATELQEEGPWDYEDEATLTKVERVERMMPVWVDCAV